MRQKTQAVLTRQQLADQEAWRGHRGKGGADASPSPSVSPQGPLREPSALHATSGSSPAREGWQLSTSGCPEVVKPWYIPQCLSFRESDTGGQASRGAGLGTHEHREERGRGHSASVRFLGDTGKELENKRQHGGPGHKGTVVPGSPGGGLWGQLRSQLWQVHRALQQHNSRVL